MNTALLTYDDVLAALRKEGRACGPVNPGEYHCWKPMLEAELGCPVVSKSTLADFGANPYKFKWEQENGVRKTSESLALGSLVDCLTLTPHLFAEQYLCEPVRVQLKKDGTPYADGRQDPAQRAEWLAKEEDGVHVISEEMLAKGKAIAAQAELHLDMLGLRQGKTYQSQIGMWAYLTELGGQRLATPVIITGMLDICPKGGALVDLKTTSVDISSATKVSYTTEDYHYGLQGALYTDLWQLCSCEAKPRYGFVFLYVSTAPPYMSRELRMTNDVLDLYRPEYQRLVRRYADCWKTNDWGDAMLEPINYQPSSWEFKRLGKEAEV